MQRMISAVQNSGMMARPPLPQALWDTLSPEVQAAVSGLVQSFDEQRIADLEERLNKNSTNSSRPPSSDPPSVKRRPPAPASGKKRGGQPGHRRHARPLVPPEQLRQVIECKPPRCRWCGDALAGDDPEPIRHQVAEVPPVRPVVDEYRLHRLNCPRCRTSTCATLPPGVPTGAFGPRLRAILSVLAGAYRLGKRPIRQLAFDLLGLSISTGMICRLERQAAAELEAPVEELREHVREAAVGPHRRDLVVAGPGQGVALGGRDEAGDGLHHRHRPGGPRSPRACWGPTPGRWSSATGSRATTGSSDASSAGRTPSERNRQLGRSPGVSSGPRPSPSPGPDGSSGPGPDGSPPAGPAGSRGGSPASPPRR